MVRTKGVSPLTTGALGAAGGAVIGATTGVLLTNRKARREFKSKLSDIREYAVDALSAVNEVASKTQLKRVKLAGAKGGKTKSKKNF